MLETSSSVAGLSAFPATPHENSHASIAASATTRASSGDARVDSTFQSTLRKLTISRSSLLIFFVTVYTPSDPFPRPKKRRSKISKPSAQALAPTAPASNTTSSDESRIRQRILNTLASRRYRQRCVDETHNLASALKETQAERDALKIQVAKLQGEVEGLKHTLQERNL